MVTWPEEWTTATIGEVFNVSAGGDVDKLPFSKVPTPIYKYEVFSNGVDNRGLYGYSSKALYPANSLTVSARGTIGRTFYRDKDFNAIIRLLVLTPKSKNVDARFYSYYIDSQVVFVRENTGVAQLTVPRIKEIIIPIPPLEEQHAIADTLSAFDRHISALSALIAKKQAVRQGALEDLMTGRTRLKGFCGSWKTVKLLDTVRLVQGLTYKPEDVDSYGTLVLRSSNIQDNKLSLDNNIYVKTRISKEKMIQEGDILVCVRNGSANLIGKSCILPAMSNTTFGAFMSVLRGDTTGFIAKVFESSIVQKQLRGRTSATINQITKKDFESITIPLPPLDEQLAISSVLSALDSEISALNAELAKFSDIRQAAISDLLTGKTRLERTPH